jgi:hypothetical protein
MKTLHQELHKETINNKRGEEGRKGKERKGKKRKPKDKTTNREATHQLCLIFHSVSALCEAIVV